MTNYREIISLHTQLSDRTYAFDACARNIGLCPHKQSHPPSGWFCLFLKETLIFRLLVS